MPITLDGTNGITSPDIDVDGSAVPANGVYRPAANTLGFSTNSTERMRIDTSGNVLVTNAGGGLGYGTGAGGTVTQATSKVTAVTLNRPTGSITMNNAALAAGARVTFVCNNSLVTTNDVVVISLSGGSVNPDDYLIRTRVFAGGFTTSVINQGAGSLSEAIVLNFAIIKGANA